MDRRSGQREAESGHMRCWISHPLLSVTFAASVSALMPKVAALQLLAAAAVETALEVRRQSLRARTSRGARARAYIYMHSERLVQLCDSAVPRKKPISRSADTLPRSLLLHYLGADSHAFPVFSTGKGAQLSRNLQRLVCSPIGVTAVAGQPAGRSSRSVRMLAARAVRGHRRGRV